LTTIPGNAEVLELHISELAQLFNAAE